MLAKNFLELPSICGMAPCSFLLAWSFLWRLTVRSSSWLSRRYDVQEILVCYQLSILVNHCNGGLEVPIVKGIDDSSHDVESLSLRNEIFLDSSGSLTILLVELPLLVLDFEVASLHEVLVFLAAALRDMPLGVLLQLDLDLIEYAGQERLLALVCLSVLGTEDLEDFSSQESPLSGVLWEFELLKHVLEVLVADPLVVVVVLDDDLEFDQAKVLVLDDIEEEV